ncbi:MAG: hypothetical protein IIX40_05880 [Alistipes sp.]|nr:hypothetical protein [Alistipes sp.]
MAYIYEHIRTNGYEPLHLEEHIEHLKEAVVNQFGTIPSLPQEGLRKAIREALDRRRCSPHTMNAVVVRYHADAEVEVEAQKMIYSHFSLRAIRPECYLHRVSGDSITDNTSVKVALLEFLHSSREGAAIWVDESNEVTAIDGQSVVAVFEDEIRFSQRGSGVEFDLAYNALSKGRRKVCKGAIRVEELYEAKELLAIGYEGVTAINHYDGVIYMDILAEKIASMVASEENF